jgi:hypothetical protein
MGLTKEDPSLVKSAEQFMTLFGIHWSNCISSTALGNLGDKFTKATQLPLTEDLLKLKRYLADDMTLMVRKLDAGVELEDWRRLVENTVVRILVFNKKRCNDAAKLTLKLYQERPDFNATELDDIKKSLQPLEKVLCKRYVNPTCRCMTFLTISAVSLSLKYLGSLGKFYAMIFWAIIMQRLFLGQRGQNGPKITFLDLFSKLAH